MSETTTPSARQQRQQRRRHAVAWGSLLVIALILLQVRVIGVVLPAFLALGCMYMVVINLVLSWTRQDSLRDVSDLSPEVQRRQHYAEDDDKPWQFQRGKRDSGE